MRDFHDAKAMAVSLRKALAEKSLAVSHSDSLELVSKAFGLDNWNILAARIEAEKVPVEASGRKRLYCSFCGKSQHEVAKLIAGPGSAICDECVALSVAIVQGVDFGSLIAKDKAAGASDGEYPTLIAFMRGRTRAELVALIAETERLIEHNRWALRQVAVALGETVRPDAKMDAYGRHRRWTRDPLDGKTKPELLAHRAMLQRHRDNSQTALAVAKGVLDETPA